MNHTFSNAVSTYLKEFLQNNYFKPLTFEKLSELEVGLTPQEYDQRGMTALFWANEKIIFEIYCDPQGGEVNCRIAELVDDRVKSDAWKYLYEISPLSDDELSRIHHQPRTLEIQLKTVLQKLTEIDFSTWIKQ
jgi:hypothetical protein